MTGWAVEKGGFTVQFRASPFGKRNASVEESMRNVADNSHMASRAMLSTRRGAEFVLQGRGSPKIRFSNFFSTWVQLVGRSRHLHATEPRTLTLRHSGAMNASRMRLETKFLRLKTPVTIGSRFGKWKVCWLGGWTRDRLSYVVMLVRVT